MTRNNYIPFPSKVLEVIPHTNIEYTFRMAYDGGIKPGQFFEVSIPKYGEAPISVSGHGDGFIDLTIRKVGRVTDEVFTNYKGSTMLLRGPYGNGFDVDEYKGKDIIVVAGGTGLSPVKGVIDYFCDHPDERKAMTAIVGFKTPSDILFIEDIARWKTNMNVILTVDNCEGDVCYKEGLVTYYLPDLEIPDPAGTACVVVGPPAMMRFTVKGLLDRDIPEKNIWVSQERKMCCGLGKCGHCRIENVYVCLDGPVFNYTESKNLID